MRPPLDCVLAPRSVAVIGASTALHKTGGRRWRSLVEAGFAGPLYPIHPSADEILGRRAYRSITEVPGPVDLAVVLVRPELVPQIVGDCVASGVPAVVVITAGFGESGHAGKRVEEDMVRAARAGGTRLLGPNCAGVFSGPGRVNVLGWNPPPGPVALISQSGNMALSFAQLAREKGLGFSRIVTIGNAADLGLAECLDHLLGDPDTGVVVVYVEGLRPMEGRALHDLIRRHGPRKPVVVFKPGRTETGRQAALSHTGALAGEDRIVDAAFRQAGALRVAESEDAWDAAIALASLPPLATSAVAVLSDGGGHATIVADTAARHGLGVPALSAPTRAALASLLSPRSTTVNPVDFAGLAEEEPDTVPRALDLCLADPEIGGAILAGHFGGYVKMTTEALGRRETAAAGEIARVVRRHGKPVIVHTIYAEEPLPALAELRRAAIPVYRSLEASAKALAAAARWARILRREPAREARRSQPDPRRVAAVLARAPRQDPRGLLEPDARDLLAAYGIPVPPFRVTASPDETARAVTELDGPVALKVVAPGIVHKTEIGGVLLDVSGPDAARAAHLTLLARARGAGAESPEVLVTPMLHGGVEAAVGAVRDAQFGPVVMFGLGGILLEALDDVAFRLAPLGQADAGEMIREIRSRRLLEGFRGSPPCDLPSAADLLIRISELVADRPDIVELDLNPVFLTARGALVADARVMLDSGSGRALAGSTGAT
jgi:acyl-CoA synthetase (NDP forming)